MDIIEVRKQMIARAISAKDLPSIKEDILQTAKHKKYPLENVFALGVAFQPLVSAVQATVSGSAGTSGLYYVNTKGSQMLKFKNGTGYLGSLKTETGSVGGGQAAMNPLDFDPTMLFMAAALMNIEKKLDDIQKLQQEMMEFLQAKEKAKLRGNVNVLIDILNNYKCNWNNEKYKNNKHILVQDIRKDAEQSIILYRGQIQKEFSKKSLIHSDREIKFILKKIQDDFKDYQLALYLYSFSTFLEIMLLENYDKQYLESVTQRIEEYDFQYRRLYTDCYNRIENMSKSSVQSIVAKGLSGVSKGAGEVIGKIPGVNKGPMDEALVTVGSKLGELHQNKTERTMSQLIASSENYILPFIENIRTINRLYNEPMEVLFDEENIYFLEA